MKPQNKSQPKLKSKSQSLPEVAHLLHLFPREGYRCGLCLKDDIVHKPLKKTYKFLGLKSGELDNQGNEVDGRISTITVCQKCAARVHLSGDNGVSVDYSHIQELVPGCEEYEQHQRREQRKRREQEVKPLTKDRRPSVTTKKESLVRVVKVAEKEIEEERLKRLPRSVDITSVGVRKKV